MNSITLEWAQEDRARVDRLLGLLEKLTDKRCRECAAVVRSLVGELEPEQAPEQVPEPEPADSGEWVKDEAAPEPEPAVSREEIQRLVVELSAAGKKAQVRDIVKAVAEKVSAIPEEKLGEVYEQLKKLGGAA